MKRKLPLNLFYLKYFCDAVKQGTISAAARENFVSQSAISQGILQLEKSLEIELITHQTKRFKTTHEGELLFESAKQVFKAVEEAESALWAKEGEIAGRIEFACTHSFALALLPHCLKRAKEEWPHLQVNFRLAHTDVIRDLLKKGSIDFGIVLDNEDLSGFDCCELRQGHYRLYTSQKKQKGLPFLLSEERLETNLLKDSYRKLYNKEMAVLMQVSSWEVIANLTEEGLGIGFFPDYVAERRKGSLMEFRSKCAPIPYKIYAILSKGSKVSNAIKAFLEMLKEQL